MTLFLALVALTVMLLSEPASAGRAVQRLSDGGSRPSEHPGRGLPRWWLAAAAALLSVAVVQRWLGPSAAALTVAALIVVGTCARLWTSFLADRRAQAARVEVAQACSALAAQVRVGRVPAEALQGAAADCPVLAVAGRAQDLGADVVAVWREQAREPGHAGLAELARAWRVSTTTGAPLAHNLEQVSDALGADVALRAVVAGELAAPRATGKIMAALPLMGLGMGYLLGGDPVEFLTSSALGWGCLVLGVGLAAAGVLWIDVLARSAGKRS